MLCLFHSTVSTSLLRCIISAKWWVKLTSRKCYSTMRGISMHLSVYDSTTTRGIRLGPKCVPNESTRSQHSKTATTTTTTSAAPKINANTVQRPPQKQPTQPKSPHENQPVQQLQPQQLQQPQQPLQQNQQPHPHQALITTLQELGFSLEKIIDAVNLSGGDLNRAFDILAS